MSSKNVLLLSDLIGRAAMMEVVCDRCGRHGRVMVATGRPSRRCRQGWRPDRPGFFRSQIVILRWRCKAAGIQGTILCFYLPRILVMNHARPLYHAPHPAAAKLRGPCIENGRASNLIKLK
jgi:hypothetical protein